MGVPDLNKTVVDTFEIPLDGPIYDGGHVTENLKLSFEVRDFGTPERTLVVRWWQDGHPYTAMASWEAFTSGLDDMRVRMLGDDWDTALSVLVGGSGDTQ
jgi:hypothetical protein